MAYAPIAFIAPNYRDFKNDWLKAYEPGTTTPKAMALDSIGNVTVAKLQLNADGFLKSAGNALVIPYIDGAYDLWLFPTEDEADSNDTSNAERLADNITAVSSIPVANELINDPSQAYEFESIDDTLNSDIPFPDKKVIHIKGSDSIWDVALTSSLTPNGISKVQSIGYPLNTYVQRPIESLDGNLLWQGSMNIWQRGFAFDDFTSRAGVIDGWSFSRSSASDGEILVIQQAESPRIQRVSGNTSASACILVGNMGHDATKEIAGKNIFINTAVRGNSLTGPLSIKVQYTTYTDLQKITAFSGVYDVGHNELVIQDITPTSGVVDFEMFEVVLNIPSDAKQVSIVYIYEPTGTAPSQEWVEFDGVSITDRPYTNIPEVLFMDAINEAQKQYRKSYAYDSFPRTISNFGSLSESSKGTATTTDTVLSESFDVSMLYAPTVTVRRPSGGGSGVDFTNETTGDNVVALVSITSSKGFRIEAAAKADAYVISDFTPSFGSVAVTYTKQEGKIIKDGDLVSFYIDIEYNTLDVADTSDINIGGLLYGGPDQDGMGNLTLNLNASTGFNLLVTDVVYPIMLSTGGSSIAFTRSTGVNYDYNDGKMNAAGRILVSGSYKSGEVYAINTYSAQYEAEARL